MDDLRKATLNRLVYDMYNDRMADTIYPVRINQAGWKKLEEMKEATASATSAEVIRKALEFYATALEEEKNGNKVVALPKKQVEKMAKILGT